MSDSQYFKDRILTILKKHRVSVREFERKIGAANGYLNNLRGLPRENRLTKILSLFPEYNRTWLLTGTGDMLATAASTPASSSTAAPTSTEAAIRIARLEAEVQSLRAQLLDKAEEIIALQRQLLRRQQ